MPRSNSLFKPLRAGPTWLAHPLSSRSSAPLLAEWHRRYRDAGLEIVGLAYEFRGDPERDRFYVESFAERHGIEFPLLLAGTSDKQAAARTLPDLTAVVAFSTTVFIGRDGRARKIQFRFGDLGYFTAWTKRAGGRSNAQARRLQAHMRPHPATENIVGSLARLRRGREF